MRMRIILLIVTLFISSFIAKEAQNNSQLQPINFANLLLDEPSIEKMVETCQFYNLTEIEGDDDIISFLHPAGWIINLKINEAESEKNPLIEVILNEKIKTIKKNLSELGYKRLSDKEYEKGSRFANRYSTCTIYSENPKIINFTKVTVKDSEGFHNHKM